MLVIIYVAVEVRILVLGVLFVLAGGIWNRRALFGRAFAFLS